MDKLKEQLAVAKEHSFWILCGGILLVSLVSWYKSTGDLQTEQKKFKGEIETAVNTLKEVSKNTEHPNDSTNKGMDAITLTFGEDVYNAWARLAENQEKVLVWGGIFGTDERFQRDVRSWRPIETKVGETEITTDSRTLYRNYILGQLPNLAKIISSKWQVDVSAVGAGGGMPGATGGAAMPGMGGAAGGPGMAGMAGMGGGAKNADVDDPSVVVTWDPTNQKEIVQGHFGLATSESIPSTLEVLYAQEDLWVFENLMNIIRTTNEGAARKHEAAIKYIDYVRIGKYAGNVGGQISLVKGNSSASAGTGGMPGMSGGGSGGMPMPGSVGGGTGGGMPAPGSVGGGIGGGMPAPGSVGPPGGGTPGATPGTGTTASASKSAILASGRYVDLKYASLDASRLISGMKGQGPKEDMLLAVAKRMPVRMQFKMDQRKLPALLAACGNSRLPVEVRQVRINRSTASSLGGTGGASGMAGGMPGATGGMPGATGGMPGAMGGMPGAMGGMPGAMGGMPGATGGMPGATGGMPGGMGGGMPGMGGGQNGARPAASIASSATDPNEISVDIYGIVYIYNPPDRKLLGIPEPPGSNPPGTLPGPVTTPASTTPPATPPITAGAATGR